MLTCITTLDQSGHGNNGNTEVLHTPQNCSFTIRYCLVSYTVGGREPYRSTGDTV